MFRIRFLLTMFLLLAVINSLLLLKVFTKNRSAIQPCFIYLKIVTNKNLAKIHCGFIELTDQHYDIYLGKISDIIIKNGEVFLDVDLGKANYKMFLANIGDPIKIQNINESVLYPRSSEFTLVDKVLFTNNVKNLKTELLQKYVKIILISDIDKYLLKIKNTSKKDAQTEKIIQVNRILSPCGSFMKELKKNNVIVKSTCTPYIVSLSIFKQ